MELNLQKAQKIKHLLEKTLEVYSVPQNIYSTAGMCLTVTGLYRNDIISKSEETLALEYIKNNVPGTFSSLSRFLHVVNLRPKAFFFKPYARKPRIKWLKHHILKLQVLIDVLNHQQKLKQ